MNSQTSRNRHLICRNEFYGVIYSQVFVQRVTTNINATYRPGSNKHWGKGIIFIHGVDAILHGLEDEAGSLISCTTDGTSILYITNFAEFSP